MKYAVVVFSERKYFIVRKQIGHEDFWVIVAECKNATTAITLVDHLNK